MAGKMLTNKDFNLNQLLNTVLHILASDPGSPSEGQFWYNSTSRKFKWRNNNTTYDITDALTLGGQNSAFHLARANHSGTQPASTISDFDTQVRTNRLDQMAAPTAQVSLGSQKIVSLADGIAAADAATLGQVQNLINTGTNKTSVRGASTANLVVLTALINGLNHDGVTYATGDRILLKNQAVGLENGLYIIAASGAASRATDADISAEVKGGLSVWINEGTANGDTRWVLTTNDPITLGVTSLTFTQDFAATATTAGAGLVVNGAALDVVGNAGRIVVNANDVDLASGVATPGTYKSVTVDTYGRVTAGTNPTTLAGYGITDGVGKYSATIGNGSLTSITITQATHGRAADRTNSVFAIDNGTGAQVECDVTIAANGDVTLGFAVAPTTNQIRVTIVG